MRYTSGGSRLALTERFSGAKLASREIFASTRGIDPLNERTEGVHTRVLELGSIEDFRGVC